MKFAPVLLLAATLTAQTPAPPATGPKHATLSGRVLDSKTGQPLRKATVSLRPVWGPGVVYENNAPYSATADAEGRFQLDNVPPGSYTLSAERVGYVTTNYGQHRTASLGTTLKVAAGAELDHLDIQMIPQAVISGRVLDQDGDPLPHVYVQLLRKAYYRGQKVNMPGNASQANETGDFRIANLPPGHYVLNATSQARMFGSSNPTEKRDPSAPDEAYVTTYYPGVIDPADAASIDLSPGQELTGFNIRLKRAAVFRVKGKIADGFANSNPLRVMLLPRDRNPFMGGMLDSGTSIKPDGSFELTGVRPGSYSIAVMSSAGGMGGIIGKIPIEVGRENIDGLVVKPSPNSSLTGTLAVEPDPAEKADASPKPIPLGSIYISLRPVEGLAFNFRGQTNPKPDGTFTIDNIGPDRYEFYTFNLPAGTYLKSATIDGQDVIGKDFAIPGGSNLKADVILGRTKAAVSGTVVDHDGKPLAGAIIALVPDTITRDDLHRLATADQTGQYKLENVAPGNYRLFAFTEIEPGANTDPDYLKPFAGAAEKLSLKADEQKSIALTAIPADVPRP